MPSDLDKISVQFLCGVPVNEISISNVKLDFENQEVLLNKTTNSDLVLKYPLKISYQKAFLKHILATLEKQGLEVHEDFYSHYARLAGVADPNSASQCEYYKHYPIGSSQKVISLIENVNLISEGTTGLRTWQASLALAEWCLNNKSALQHKTVLELGSGIGLTGLVLSLECHPKRTYFSDCHPSVLRTLSKNIETNCKNIFEDHDKKSSFSSYSGGRVIFEDQLPSGVNISVINLPWEDVDDSVCKQFGKIDVILAADVVYDSALFNPLIDALKFFSQRCDTSNIIFACTERNLETLDEFLESIGKHFKITEEACPTQNNFTWSPVPPVRIFHFECL